MPTKPATRKTTTRPVTPPTVLADLMAPAARTGNGRNGSNGAAPRANAKPARRSDRSVRGEEKIDKRNAEPARATRDPEQTRQRILDAAKAEFARVGLGGARVDRIAQEAGANKRMLYYYFGNKEDLF